MFNGACYKEVMVYSFLKSWFDHMFNLQVAVGCNASEELERSYVVGLDKTDLKAEFDYAEGVDSGSSLSTPHSTTATNNNSSLNDTVIQLNNVRIASQSLSVALLISVCFKLILPFLFSPILAEPCLSHSLLSFYF